MFDESRTRATRVAAVAALLSLGALAVAQPAAHPDWIRAKAAEALDQNPNLPYNPYVVLVKFAPEATDGQRYVARALIGGGKMDAPRVVPGLEIVSTYVEPSRAVQLLARTPGVEYAELDYTLHADVIPNDPGFGQLWGMHNIGQSGGVVDADIDAPEAWDLFTGSSNVVVAVIDTGIQRTHPDLAANMWTNPDEIAGNGIDDDGNGYVDDLYGWDFVNNDNDPNDDHSHGTHCAGTIGGVGDNGQGVAGVAWSVKLVGLKFLSARGSGSTSNAVLAVNYCYGKGIKISSNSWGGGGYSQSLSNAIQNAGTIGHVFVAAAGNSNVNNDSSPHYPSSYALDNIVSVASIDRTDSKSSFSNYGVTSVDLGAPGSSIYSTVPTSSYGTKSGTSMATPHVSGAFALLMGYRPDYTRQQLIAGVFSTVRPTSAMSGRVATGGVLNVFSMLQAAGGGGGGNTAPTVAITAPANGHTVSVGTSITFQGTASDPEDGSLTGSLAWTSSLGGPIGTGGSFSTSGLSVGTHTITATVVDSGGLVGSDSITVIVQDLNQPPAAPSGLSLNKVKRVTAELTWTDNSDNETGFRIERQTKSGRNWSTTRVVVVPADTTLWSELPGSGQYRYRVQASNANGDSDWTSWVQGKF